MHNSLVSIIIPCWNGEQYLEEFLASLAAQDYPCVEILFVDDGSTDNTALLYKSFEKNFPERWVSKYIYQSHSGQAAAVSLALTYVTGEYLMWSDSDDIMLPGSISQKAGYLSSHPQYDMVRNDFYFFYEDSLNLVVGYGANKSKGEDIFEGVFDSTMPCLAGTYMMRTSLIFQCYPDKKIPLSDEGQNFQLLLPAASRSKCGFVDEKLMKYRIHKGSHSNHPRSISEQFRRAEGFLKLRTELLDYCICDRDYYEALALKIYNKTKKDIVLSVIANAKKEKMKGNKMYCTGCGACAHICTENAITMLPDEEGFLYPKIDKALCVKCGKCSTSCEIASPEAADYGIAFRNNDEAVVRKSSSGGAFAAIAAAFWDNHPDGYVYGAAFDSELTVIHKGVNQAEGIDSFHGSKYVQSRLEDTYKEIAEHLSNDRAVLFSGTPCQCSAVRNIFGYNEKLLVVDVVCNGTSSPAVFKKYIEKLNAAHHSKVVSYNFRNKNYDLGRGMICSFEDGSVLENSHGKDRFCKMYFSNMISRPSCSDCKFTTPDRNSDITLGDFHGLETLDPDFYKSGTSLVIPHTGAGKIYADNLSKAGQTRIYPIEKCSQPRLQSPAKSHMLRRFILRDYISLADELFEKKYGKII